MMPLLPDVQSHLPALRRYALVLTRDPDRAEDLVQEALARALAGAGSWRPGGNLRTWLLSVMHNAFVSGWRRARAEREGLRALAHADATGPPGQDAAVEFREVMGALMRLPDGARDVLLLVSVEGLSYREVAEVQGVPVGTVMSRLSRARAQLRQELGDRPVAARPRLKVVE